MTYEFYKVLHLLGVVLLFTALGGLAILAARGGTPEEVAPLRRPLMIAHGLALVLLLVAGFGLLARMGMGAPASWGLWVYAKAGLWVLLGGIIALIRRQGALGGTWVWLLPAFGVVAAYLAVFKP